VLLLCDLDGTLVDARQAFSSWCRVLAERHQQPADFVDWMEAEERAGAWAQRTLFPNLRDRLGIEASPADADARFMDDFTAQFRCDPPVRRALGAVKAAGHQIAIVTNGGPTQANKVEAARLTELADALCISSVEGVAKPDPELLRIAARRAAATLDGAWMVGDSPADVRAAVDAGIRSVWLGGARVWTEEAFGPTAVAASFPEAVDIVMASWSP
jgi:putative hydrolase of the HAD superfamily